MKKRTNDLPEASIRLASTLLLWALSLLLALPASLDAQVPGQRIPSRERVHAEFINNILDGINDTRESWMEEIEGDRLDALMAIYTSDAMVIPPGGQPLYGRDAIRSYWEETLPDLGGIQTGLGDLDASGQMAMVGGTYSLNRIGDHGNVVPESGGLLTVFVQTGRRWFIRAQVFATRPSG